MGARFVDRDRTRRLICPRCAATRDWFAQRRGGVLVGAALGGPNDPFLAAYERPGGPRSVRDF